MEVNSMNTCLKELLSYNKNYLCGLHACIGLDFCKDMYTFSISGKFTINSVLKTAAAAGFTPEKDLIVINTLPLEGYYSRFRFMAAIIDDSGKLDIEVNHCGYNNGVFVNIETFYTKQQFNDIRKKENKTIVICQNREFLHDPIRYKKDNNIDLNQRFKLLSAPVHESYIKKIPRINTLNLQLLDCNGLEYQCDVSKQETAIQSDLIDKSGYLLFNRREQLRRRADEIKAEKEKKAYSATDNTENFIFLLPEVIHRNPVFLHMNILWRFNDDLCGIKRK